MQFAEFYKTITGFSPFPYQKRFAEGALPELLNIPTGLGKTASVVLGWRYKRHQSPNSTPRRLVYCLPMRSLVKQVEENAKAWFAEEAAHYPDSPAPEIVVSMGGQKSDHYLDFPEKDVLIIGTQDMLLSRALNRGYGMSRYMWPMAFGALNNDALWVFDETQLQGVAIETSAQLQAFRKRLGLSKGSHTLWASATLDESRLQTINVRQENRSFLELTLDENDHAHPIVEKRVHAKKRLHLDAFEKAPTPTQLAEAISERHISGSLTLVIVNQVERAQALYSALLKRFKPTKDDTTAVPKIGLIHSRFRPNDRQAMEEILLSPGDRIVVSTQAIEAGVDVSSRTLFTELAPWSSLVQRFGRANRYGENDESDIILVPLEMKASYMLPYEEEELNLAENALQNLHAMGEHFSIQELKSITVQEPFVLRPVIRERDLLELFDNSSDILGLDLDVSSYIRDGDDNSVQCYWREITETPSPNEASPTRQELCSVSISQAKKLVKSITNSRKSAGKADKHQHHYHAYRWNPLEDQWASVDESGVKPGQTLLFSNAIGTYDPTLGFTGTLNTASQLGKKPPVPLLSKKDSEERERSLQGDPDTYISKWVELPIHLQDVKDEAELILENLDLDETSSRAVTLAALWHDVGKAHRVFQNMLTKNHESRQSTLWAKSDHSSGRAERPFFRHELASALAWLEFAPPHTDELEKSLVAWLIATHHGKIRLTLRSIPGEQEPPDRRPFARGVWENDVLPEIQIPGHGQLPQSTLSLELLGLGPNSWSELGLKLRNHPEWGPFRLAYLECLVRAADHRASAKEAQ